MRIDVLADGLGFTEGLKLTLIAGVPDEAG
jgi:hypothetical protein